MSVVRPSCGRLELENQWRPQKGKKIGCVDREDGMGRARSLARLERNIELPHGEGGKWRERPVAIGRPAIKKIHFWRQRNEEKRRRLFQDFPLRNWPRPARYLSLPPFFPRHLSQSIAFLPKYFTYLGQSCCAAKVLVCSQGTEFGEYSSKRALTDNAALDER